MGEKREEGFVAETERTRRVKVVGRRRKNFRRGRECLEERE